MLKEEIQFIGILLIAIFAYSFVHEFTHVALNEFRVEGFCILNCPPVEGPGIFGNHYAPMAVKLSEPIRPPAKDENNAFWSGTIAFAAIIFTGAVLMRKKRTT